MPTRHHTRRLFEASLLSFLIVTALHGGLLHAQAPAAPRTLWNFLGIPQGTNKIRDASTNKRGNHPEWERKPPMKAIADPENLDSPSPAVKKAAEVKMDADLAPQKIKAIKYLATVGCGCYPGVSDALAEELGSCTEEVRYMAALALCELAGNPCTTCNKNSCCNAVTMNKLNTLANGKDGKGCPVETSARVRNMAQGALDACKNVRRPTTPEPEPTPIPTPEPEQGPRPEGPRPEGTSPPPAVLPPGNSTTSRVIDRVLLDSAFGYATASDSSADSSEVVASDQRR